MTARSSVQDALKKFQFRVTIPGLSDEATVARFVTVSEIGWTVAVDSLRGGGQNLYSEKSAGRPETKDVTFSRGFVVDPTGNVSSSTAILNWFNQVAHGQSNGHADREYRRDVLVEFLRRDGTVGKSITLLNAFPIDLTYSDSDANATQGDRMETFILTYERPLNPEALPPPPIGGTNNAALNVTT